MEGKGGEGAPQESVDTHNSNPLQLASQTLTKGM